MVLRRGPLVSGDSQRAWWDEMVESPCSGWCLCPGARHRGPYRQQQGGSGVPSGGLVSSLTHAIFMEHLRSVRNIAVNKQTHPCS